MQTGNEKPSHRGEKLEFLSEKASKKDMIKHHIIQLLKEESGRIR